MLPPCAVGHNGMRMDDVLDVAIRMDQFEPLTSYTSYTPQLSPPFPSPSSPPPLPLLRSTLCARGWPSATPGDGSPQAGGAGDCCVSPLRRMVSMVLCGSARLLSQPASSTSPPVLLPAFAAGCVG